MMYAENAEDVRKKRKAFLAKWRVRCRGVADSLEGEAAKRTIGERLLPLPRLSAAAMEVLAHHRQRIR